MTANHAHTPTWDRVREHYYLGRQQFDDPLFPAGGVTEIVAEFDRWYQAEIAAAEQRGAARGKIEGLREAATIIRDSKFANSVKPPSKKVQVKEADWLDALADRLEGENGDV